MAHGKECMRGRIVQYELDVFGLSLVLISVFNWHRDAELSIGPILYERGSGVCITWKAVD